MFALGREDVFPVEDLGVRRGMEQVCGRELTRPEMRECAEAWRPYRSYASRYLWRAYEG
jgi:DNA-3-methyladenine glycosylase II